MTRDDDFTYLGLAMTLSAVALYGSLYALAFCIRMDKDKPEYFMRYLFAAVISVVFIVFTSLLSLVFDQGKIWWVGLTFSIIILIDMIYAVLFARPK